MDPATSLDEPSGLRRHMLLELGFGIRKVEGQLVGWALVIPEMHVPGTAHLRTSILATWTDMLCGLLAVQSMKGRVPVTLELDVQLYRPAPASGTITAIGKPLKQGRTVFVAGVTFEDDDGEEFAFGSASFMSSPDPAARLPSALSLDMPPPEQTLSIPLAERSRCRRLTPGTVSMPRSEDGLNAANTVNGGLLALAVEEAALSLSPDDTLCALHIRYLQPVRIGPVIAPAHTRSGLGKVEVRDEGSDDRLAAIATTRIFGPGTFGHRPEP